MTRLLVTGAAGFVGTALRQSLSDHYDLIAIDREAGLLTVDPQVRVHDLRSDDPLPDADVIVHLAAHSQVRPTIETPELAVENLAMTRRILDHAVNQSATIVLASSREVYGSARRADEQDIDFEVANPYGASKIAMESLASGYSSCFDLEVITLRVTNAYGPYELNRRVIPIFITKALRGEELVVYGREKVLDFVWVFDIVNAIDQVINQRSALAGETINIGSGIGTSLTDLAEQIVELVGSTAGYTVQPNRTGEPDQFIADIRKARSLLDFKPTSLDEGLEQTLDWYRDNELAFNHIVSQMD